LLAHRSRKAGQFLVSMAPITKFQGDNHNDRSKTHR
jgi:hypothetical protein